MLTRFDAGWVLTASLPAVPVISVAVQSVSTSQERDEEEDITVFLASSHHPTTEQLGNAAVIKLDNPQGIVSIIILAQFRRDRCDTNSSNRFHHGILAKEPQSQVDIVD